jgi:hypothetical protein
MATPHAITIKTDAVNAVSYAFAHMCAMRAQYTTAARIYCAACDEHNAACIAYQESDVDCGATVAHIVALGDAVTSADRAHAETRTAYMNSQDAHRWAEDAHQDTLLAALRATYK